MTKRRTKQPWIDGSGNLKELHVLKKESKNWSFNQWEQYLQAVEVVSRENPQSNFHIDCTAVETFVNYISDNSGYTMRPLLRNAIKRAVKGLNYKEFIVYQGLYQDNKTQKEIADELGLNKSQVHRYKASIHKKILTIFREKNISDPYQQLKEVYQPIENKQKAQLSQLSTC